MDDLYIRKVLGGDTGEFRYFIATYKDLAFSVAISVVKDEFLAEEVVQESFIKVFNNLKSFKGRSSFKTWFCRIVINEAFQLIRKKKPATIPIDSLNDIETIINEDDILDISKEEQSFMVQEALKMLSSKESLVLRLFYLEQQDTKTIADETGWSDGNVRVILYRARKNMLVFMKELMKDKQKNKQYG